MTRAGGGAPQRALTPNQRGATPRPSATPRLLILERDGGLWIASTDTPPVYGTGKTRRAARADYRVSLAEYTEIMTASGRPEDRGIVAFLQGHTAHEVRS